MNRDVAHCYRRHVARELRPQRSAVDREKQSKLGSGEKQIAIDSVLANHVRVAFDRISRERLPCLAEVGRLENVNFHVAGLMTVESNVGCAAIEPARLDA